MVTIDKGEDTGQRIAVVICTRDRPVVLERCLKALGQVEGVEFSTIVVDSAPRSTTAQSVALQYGAKYVLVPQKGLSRARNVGTRMADADIIAYLDDDMVPSKHWLAYLCSEFTDAAVAVATGSVLNLDFANGSDVDLRLALEFAPVGPHRTQIDRSSRHWFERTNFGGIGDGNLALRRTAFAKIDGFDERLGRGAVIDSGEEHYAYFRSVECGLKIAHMPSAIVFHPASSTSEVTLEKNLSDTIAYIAFLLWHHPSQLRRVVKFLLEGILGVRRWWHPACTHATNALSTSQKIRSGFTGLSIFFKSLQSGSTANITDYYKIENDLKKAPM
jgi:O-antigen biosynthesis protein